MRIAMVYTYPLYHDIKPIEEWWNHRDRERVFAGLIADRGYDVEIWAAGNETEIRAFHSLKNNRVNVKVFKADQKGKQTKYHTCDSLVEYAKKFEADYVILKGVDGGVGKALLKRYLQKIQKPFAFIIGGECYSPFVPKADIVFYESRLQKERLQDRGLRFWQPGVAKDRLVRLPKWIDTKTFYPRNEMPKKWDIMIISRLISYYKNFTVLGPLSEKLRIGVIGTGPFASRLQRLYPKIHWLGYIPNKEIPEYLNQAHLFMHTSFNDYYPRVIAEALACGLPCVAFKNSISSDVVPKNCGMLVSKQNYSQTVINLLLDKKQMQKMSREARNHALSNMADKALDKPLNTFLNRLENRINEKAIQST